MENVPETKDFRKYRKGEDLEIYLRDFLIFHKDQYKRMASRINWLLERIHVTTETSGVLDQKDGTRFMVVEFIPPGATKNDNGNWRLKIVEDTANSTWDLELEMRRSGVWTSAKVHHG
jgi:hypothetical protein